MMGDIREAFSRYAKTYFGGVVLHRNHMQQIEELEAKLVARVKELESNIKKLEEENQHLNNILTENGE